MVFTLTLGLSRVLSPADQGNKLAVRPAKPLPMVLMQGVADLTETLTDSQNCLTDCLLAAKLPAELPAEQHKGPCR